MHDALTIVAVAAVGTAFAFGILVVARSVQPGSRIVDRGLVPRPVQWLVGWARARTFRVWSADPATMAALVAASRSGGARERSRRGLVPAASAGDADTLISGDADMATGAAHPLVLLALDCPPTAACLGDAVRHAARVVRDDIPLGRDVTVPILGAEGD